MVSSGTILKLKNNQSVELRQVEILQYDEFYKLVLELMNLELRHCVNYFAFHQNSGLQFLMVIADDQTHEIYLLSHFLKSSEKQEIASLTPKNYAFHIFEREISENFGVNFLDHPWLKPVRFAHNRANQKQHINDYPFYSIQSEELHEVGVGPIHAGIIEPGHFRFICNGEKVLHLEIQLGWQHRGIEQIFIDKKNNLQRSLLAENIAGDSVIGHTTAFVQTMEALSVLENNEQLNIERALALELERIAMHTADIAALCVDAAYHLGANVFGVLRTPIINFMLSWCGNRFGKSLIRPGGTHFPFTEELKSDLLTILDNYEKQFEEMVEITYRLPSIQNRFDNVGKVSKQQALSIGTVGLSARMSGVERDIRKSHPNWAYEKFPYQPIVLEKGDVFARFLLKRKEITQSIEWIRNLLKNITFKNNSVQQPEYSAKLKPGHFAISMTEAWRGEVCHCAVTDQNGELQHYKVKDPSVHNWKALELSLRNVDISDFPINNKSYDLSYCGNDL